MNPSYFFLGYVKIKCDYDNITPLLNICMYCRIPYSNFFAEKDGVSLVFRLSEFKKLQKEAASRGVNYKVESRGGLPVILSRYKYRFGIFAGVLVSIALIIEANSFVWDIEVTGNESITTREIKEMLEAEGFSVGTYIPRANTDRIENKVLMNTDRISWMSINIIGTVAEVQIRELDSPKEEQTSQSPANLVAKTSGIVEEVRVFKGNVVVSSGQYVKEGELLVSGLYDSMIEGIRYTRADGKVYARTYREIFVEIPFEYDEKCYTGVEYYDKFLNFFDYSINISKNSRKEDSLYDKINIVEDYCLPGGKETPFGVTTVKYLEYKWTKSRRTDAEAEELAYFELSKVLSDAAEDSILLKKTVTPIVTENSFGLLCSVVMIEDIAAVSEFEVELSD